MYEYCIVTAGLDKVNQMALDGWRVCAAYHVILPLPSGNQQTATCFVMERSKKQ
jgi:hypothetical protein